MENLLILYLYWYFLYRREKKHFDGLGPNIFRRKMEKSRHKRDEMDGKLFISRQSWHFSFIVYMIKVLIPICTLTWRVN